MNAAISFAVHLIYFRCYVYIPANWWSMKNRFRQNLNSTPPALVHEKRETSFFLFLFPQVINKTNVEIDKGNVHKWRPTIFNFFSTLPPALCVQMDFTRTFEANTKCNNNKYVWSQFYQILVVLKYHRRLWNNIFDTDILTCINTHIKGVNLAFLGIFMLLEMCVSKILYRRRLWYFRTTKIW